jgi:peroxiredoxin
MRGDGAGGTASKSQVTPQMADRGSTVGAKSARPAGMPEKRTVSGNRPGGASSGNRSSRSNIPLSARQRAAASKANKGFQVRPLDLGLVALGLVVVMLIVWSMLGNSNNAASPQVANNPGTAPNSQPADPSMPVPLKLGTVAPDFNLPAPDGKTYSLSQYKGKVVMLELFAPWCPHCQADAPAMNEVYEKYKDKGVQVIAVSASPYGRTYEEDLAANKNPAPISLEDVTWFRDTYKVNFPILFDKDIKVGKDYGLAFYPTIYIIDKDGKIASEPAGDFVVENGKPVSSRTEAINLEFLSAELDKVLK